MSSLDQRISSLILLESMFPNQTIIDDKEVEEVVKRQDHEFRSACEQITCQFSVAREFKLLLVLHKEGHVSAHVQQSRDACLKGFEEELKANSDLIEIIMKSLEFWRKREENKEMKTKKEETRDESLARFWIFSHHIKSARKRQLIMDLTRDLKLKGLTCVGKPGFVVVEGLHVSCEAFWTRVRAENWQRISLIETEIDLKEEKFFEFKEISNSNQFMRELEEKEIEKVVKKFFGFKEGDKE